jgi:hypothetical protein
MNQTACSSFVRLCWVALPLKIQPDIIIVYHPLFLVQTIKIDDEVFSSGAVGSRSVVWF